MNVDTATAESLASFAADGFVALRQFVGGEEVAALRANVDRFITDVVPQMPPEQIFYEHKNDPATLKQIQQMSVHDAWFHEWLTASRFRKIAEVLLEGSVVPKNLQYFNKSP